MTKVCTECGQECTEFYNGYARCKKCTKEDQNALRWYKEVEAKPIEQWPEKLTSYVASRREYVTQGRSIPRFAQDIIYMLDTLNDEALPSDLEVTVLWQRLCLLEARVAALEARGQERTSEPTHTVDIRTAVGELRNLAKKIDLSYLDDEDQADVREGIRQLNQAIATGQPFPPTAILSVVLTLVGHSVPEALEEMYLKYYASWPQEPSSDDIDKVVDIAGVNLYTYNWLQFIAE